MKICSTPQPQSSELKILSSRQIGWKGILVEHYQAPSNHIGEQNPGALLAHWLSFPSVQPMHLVQKHGERWHKSIIKQSDLVLVPAGQPTYWRGPTDTPMSNLCMYLQPELVANTAISADLNPDRIELIDCFSQSDLHLYQIAMMLLAEIRSGGILGELYVESLIQVLVIHLLRHYCVFQPEIIDRYDLPPRRLESAFA